MQLNEYQSEASKTAVLGHVGVDPIVFLGLCLSGEVGEVNEKIKKALFANEDVHSVNFKENISHELGDVLWYLSQLAKQLNLKLEDIAKENLIKVTTRKERGVLGGEGDNR
jgi:NTP pyrophosphatase (non-canonical NTP hydrolase)